MILITSLFATMIHTELNLQTFKMHILQAPERSAKRTMASIGSVFSLNSPRYRFLDHFHMTGCICALRTMGKTSFHFGKVHTYKGMDEGWEEYQILDHVWAVIGKETATASNTIPAAFGQRTLTIYTKAHAFMAE